MSVLFGKHTQIPQKNIAKNIIHELYHISKTFSYSPNPTTKSDTAHAEFEILK